MILNSNDILKPSDTLSYADVIIGLPTLIICLQVIPFAFFFFHAYSIKPYTTWDVKRASDSQQPLSETGSSSLVKRYQGGPLGIYAWLALLNPLEFFRNIKNTYDMFHDSKVEEQKETGSLES